MAVTTRLKNAFRTGGYDGVQVIVDERRRIRMDKIDNLSPELRQCVHDYGWNVVNAYLLLGINKAKHIRHLVETVLNEFSPTRGACSNQGNRRAPGMPASELPSEKPT